MADPVKVLMDSLAPLIQATTVRGIEQMSRRSVVQLRDWEKGPLHDWQCGGFTYAHMIHIAAAYNAVKKAQRNCTIEEDGK